MRIKPREGQALVEFALVLPLFVLVLFGIIEMSRLMNFYMALSECVRTTARHGASSDFTLSKSPREVAMDFVRNFNSNPLLRVSVQSLETQPPSDVLSVDVNHREHGLYCTRVDARMTVEFLLLPSTMMGRKIGRVPVSASSVMVNEIQGERKTAGKAYAKTEYVIRELALEWKHGISKRGRP